MMKSGNRLIFSILVFGIVVLSLVIVPVSATKLASPVLVSPPNNQHLFNQNPVIGFSWNPVNKADQYDLVIQKKVGNTWQPLLAYATWNVYFMADNWQTLGTFAGTYRWSVTAKDTTGKYTDSNPSTLRSFYYPDDPVVAFQLAKPKLVLPLSNTVFKGGVQDIFFTWSPVPGAGAYILYIEKYDSSTKKWVWHDTRSVTGCLNSGIIYSFTQTGKYRWQIVAQGTAGGYSNSPWSALNTLTITT